MQTAERLTWFAFLLTVFAVVYAIRNWSVTESTLPGVVAGAAALYMAIEAYWGAPGDDRSPTVRWAWMAILAAAASLALPAIAWAMSVL